MLASVCEQMCVVLSLDPIKEVKNKDIMQLINFFYTSCEQIAKEGRQLLILVDGLQDINVDKNLLKESLYTNNQISWLFNKVLPPGVHLIVSVKRQISSIKVDGDELLPKRSSKNALRIVNGDSKEESTTSFVPQTPIIVSFFLNSYNEKIPADAETCLFEFPYNFKKINANEITAKYFRNQLEKYDRTISEKWLQSIVVASMNQPLSTEGNSNPQPTVATGDSNQISFLYLNLLIKEILSANPLNNNLKHLLNENDFPKDLESLIKFKISKTYSIIYFTS